MVRWECILTGRDYPHPHLIINYFFCCKHTCPHSRSPVCCLLSPVACLLFLRWTYQGKGHPFIPPGLQRKRELFIDHIGMSVPQLSQLHQLSLYFSHLIFLSFYVAGYGPDFADADPLSEKPTESSIRTKLAHYNHYITRMKQDNKAFDVDRELRIIDILKEQLHNLTGSVARRSSHHSHHSGY